MFIKTYLITRLFIILLLFISVQICFSQETPKLLIISNKVGDKVDPVERKRYKLFLTYHDSIYKETKFYRMPNGTINAIIYKKNGAKDTIYLEEKEYQQIQKKINSTMYYAKLEEGLSIEIMSPKEYDGFTADELLQERRHKTYVILKYKKLHGDLLTREENEWLLQYNTYLDEYYSNMSEEEKEKYHSAIEPEERREQIGISDNKLYLVEKDEYPIPTAQARENKLGISGSQAYHSNVYLDITILGANASYENKMFSKIKYSMNWRIGYGMSAGIFDYNHQHLLLSTTYLRGRRMHFLEVDLGLFLVSELHNEGLLKWSNVWGAPLFSVGYRYEEPDGPVFFRFGVGAEPIFCHIGIGIRFNMK